MTHIDVADTGLFQLKLQLTVWGDKSVWVTRSGLEVSCCHPSGICTVLGGKVILFETGYLAVALQCITVGSGPDTHTDLRAKCYA